MVRLNENENGFAHLIGFIIITIVILAILGVGLTIWHKNHKTNTDSASRAGSCKSDPNAMFTHDFSEPEKLSIIQPPVIAADNIRDRAWPSIDTTKTDKVAIYSPAEVDMTSGIYKVEKIGSNYADFDLWFELSCERWFFINHISDPVEKVRQLLPKTPNAGATNGPSATAGRTELKNPVHFTSGELLGYTNGTSGAHNFDLGVFDNNHQNVMPSSYTGGADGRENHAICSFDLFPSEIKAKYYDILKNSPKVAGSLCP